MLSFDVCECGAPLQRMERETPKPQGAEVVLKVLAAGVCHSDLHIWDGYYDIGGGQTKMDAAKKVVGDLFGAIPNGRNLAFVVYGHDASVLPERPEMPQIGGH